WLALGHAVFGLRILLLCAISAIGVLAFAAALAVAIVARALVLADLSAIGVARFLSASRLRRGGPRLLLRSRIRDLARRLRRITLDPSAHHLRWLELGRDLGSLGLDLPDDRRLGRFARQGRRRPGQVHRL